MQGSKIITIFVLAAILVVTAVPSSLTSAFSVQNVKDEKVEKFIDLAEEAGQKVGNLIDNIYVNETALDIIEAEGYRSDLEGNVSLYYKGLENVTNAYSSFENGDYEGAIANATEALRIFREVFKSLNIILEQSGIRKGELVDAQGLIVAMQRALERIERLRELLDDPEALELLDEAEACLDIETARTWLLEGRVNETAHNLTKANHFIAEAHKYLKLKAREINRVRVMNFLEQADRIMEQLMNRLRSARNKGFNITEILQTFGCRNEEEFREGIRNIIQSIRGKIEEFKNIIQDLNALFQRIREMNQQLARIEGNGNGKGPGKP